MSNRFDIEVKQVLITNIQLTTLLCIEVELVFIFEPYYDHIYIFTGYVITMDIV